MKKYIILTIILLILFTVCFSVFRMRGGIFIKPSVNSDSNNIVYYLQNDPQWKDMPLGNSKFKMKDSGCLTTVIASALCIQNNINNITPEDICMTLTNNNVYDSDGNIQWEPLQKALNINVKLKSPEDITSNYIDTLLSNDIYPIIRVRILGVGAIHYVLIAKSNNNKYWCIDPLNQSKKLVPMSFYGNRIYGLRYIVK